MFNLFRRYRQNQALLVAAIRAERWFTHQECVGNQTLDYEAFQSADAIRGAVHAIQEDEPLRVERAAAEVKTFPYGDDQ